jgi:hypothetical protein
MPFAGFDDFDDCLTIMTEEEGHDDESARNICGALQAEAKADHGDVAELKDAIERGAGLVADVGVDLVSGVDTPAVNSKWTMLKSTADGHDWQANSPILLSKADGGSDKRIAYAAAMIPREPDKEGDVVPTATVEQAAHDFLKNGDGIDTDHSMIEGDGEPVESWVLKEGRTFDLADGGTETYQAGTWMLGVEWGAEAWDRIKSGELTGLSIAGMAEHVPLQRSVSDCGCGTATTKQLDIPLANESVVHLVYESRTAAEKASEEIGLGGDVHEHEFDGMTVFMPGETHDDFVERYMELSEQASEDIEQAVDDAVKFDNPCWDGYEMVGTKTDENGNEVPNCVPEEDVPDAREQSADGTTVKGADTESGDMGSETTTDGDGPTVDDLAASVDDLSDTVASIKDELDSGDGADPTVKADIEDAAEMIAQEMDFGAGDVMDILQAAEGTDPQAVIDGIRDMQTNAEHGDMDDDEEEEKTADGDGDSDPDSVEKRTEEARLDKGYSGEGTRQDAIDSDAGTAGGSGGLPSYGEIAKEAEQEARQE